MNPFTFEWEAPISDEDRDKILTKIACEIKRRGLETPAILFLESHRPLAPLGGQLAVMFSPFLGIFFAGGAFDLQKYTSLLRDPKNVNLLIKMIETSSPILESGQKSGALAQ